MSPKFHSITQIISRDDILQTSYKKSKNKLLKANEKKLKYAPRDIFVKILEYAVMPIIELVIWFMELEHILNVRKIPAYEKTRALPGLRIRKPEGINDTIVRIARNEIGVDIELADKKYLLGFLIIIGGITNERMFT